MLLADHDIASRLVSGLLHEARVELVEESTTPLKRVGAALLAERHLIVFSLIFIEIMLILLGLDAQLQICFLD